MITPEIVMGLSLLLFFLQLFDAHGSVAQLWVAHITFCVSYVAVVAARAANMDPRLEEAARDLGASAWGAFRYVTLPLIAPAVLAGGLLAFSLSFDDDYVVTTFNSGVGSSTLPLYIYGRIKFGVTPRSTRSRRSSSRSRPSPSSIAWRAGAFDPERASRSSRRNPPAPDRARAPTGGRGLVVRLRPGGERVAVARGNRTAAMSPSNTSSSSLGWGRRTGAAPSAGN